MFGVPLDSGSNELRFPLLAPGAEFCWRSRASDTKQISLRHTLRLLFFLFRPLEIIGSPLYSRFDNAGMPSRRAKWASQNGTGRTCPKGE